MDHKPRVIAELPNGTFNLEARPYTEALCAADWRLVQNGEGHELRVTVKLTDELARQVHRWLSSLGAGIPEAEAFGAAVHPTED